MSTAKRSNETITPSDVFAAIEEAKRQNPKDKEGDKAIRIRFDRIRDGKNGTRWMSQEILKQNPKTGKWEYVPILLKVLNATTTANIKTEEEKEKAGQGFPGIYLQFSGDTTFEREITRNGHVVKTVTEPYGQAKVAISNMFYRNMYRLLKTGKVYAENDKIKKNVQTHRWINKAKGEKEELEKAIVRVKIPYEGGSTTPTVPSIKIYDVERPRKLTPEERGTRLPYEIGQVDGRDFDYVNIRSFLRFGSAVSFVEDLSGVCISSQGPSNPARVKDFLIVKKGRGRSMECTDVFDASEFASMGETAVFEGVEPAETVAKTPAEQATVEISADLMNALNGEEEDIVIPDDDGLGGDSPVAQKSAKPQKQQKPQKTTKVDDELGDDLDDLDGSVDLSDS